MVEARSTEANVSLLPHTGGPHANVGPDCPIGVILAPLNVSPREPLFWPAYSVYMVRRLLSLLFPLFLLSLPSSAQDHTWSTFTHSGTTISTRFGADVEQRTRTVRAMGGTVKAKEWTSETSCCGRTIIAMDVGSLFANDITPDQLSTETAQRVFEGSIERFASTGREKLSDVKESYQGYPSRVVSFQDQETNLILAIRYLMVKTTSWCVMWSLHPRAMGSEDGLEDYTPRMTSYLRSIKVGE